MSVYSFSGYLLSASYAPGDGRFSSEQQTVMTWKKPNLAIQNQYKRDSFYSQLKRLSIFKMSWIMKFKQNWQFFKTKFKN